MTTNALALSDTMSIGKLLAESGFFSDTKGAAQAVVKVLAGQELGFGPIASMTGVNIIKGRVTLSANLLAAAVKRSGRYNYRVLRLDDAGCEIEFYENGKAIGISKFDDDDAKNAGLTGDNWRKFRRNMHFARSVSNGTKWYCPDIFGGPIYTPDELGAMVDGETGEVIEIVDAGVQSPAEAPPDNGDGVSEPAFDVQDPTFPHGTTWPQFKDLAVEHLGYNHPEHVKATLLKATGGENKGLKFMDAWVFLREHQEAKAEAEGSIEELNAEAAADAGGAGDLPF